MIEAFVNSVLAVGLGELGDKTQLLALVLAARYRQRLPVIGGIFAATCLLMTLTSAIGVALGQSLPREALRLVIGIAFLAIAVWTLIPERDDVDELGRRAPTRNAFMASLIGFALAELGDKSQIATLTLAAKYQSFLPVAAGSIVGEMIAIVPAVLLGHGTAQVLPLRWVRLAAALLFAVFGVAVLAGWGQ